MKHCGRLVVAVLVVVVVVIAALLGVGTQPLSSNTEQLGFRVGADSAVRFFIAVGVGAMVARRSFVVPALSLAMLTWVALTYILYSIALPAGPVSFAEIAAGQLAGLLLMAAAAVLGALLGRWFYKHEVESVVAAA